MLIQEGKFKGEDQSDAKLWWKQRYSAAHAKAIADGTT